MYIKLWEYQWYNEQWKIKTNQNYADEDVLLSTSSWINSGVVMTNGLVKWSLPGMGLKLHWRATSLLNLWWSIDQLERDYRSFIQA